MDRPAATPTPAGSAPAPTGHGESVVAARQERLASRLLDDERLRADLTDDAYQPILDWAVGVSDRMAASTARLDDAAAEPVLDQQSAALKELVGSIVQAVGAYESGDVPARAAALREAARLATGSALSAFLGASDQAKRRPLSRFERASASGRSDGPELARRIVAALSPASHATRPSESEAS